MIKLNIKNFSELSEILKVSNAYVSMILTGKKSFSYNFVEKLNKVGIYIND